MFRVKHHEFWNTHVFHLPIYLYWLYLSVKARSLFFFSAANPGIETGGLMGESKYRILSRIPQEFLPVTLYFARATEVQEVLRNVQAAGLSFPVVAKPDVGQGGWMIEIIRDGEALETFLRKIRIPFLLQEFVPGPIEAGVLYFRMPGQERGVISSLVIKEFLTVVGDGTSTVAELLRRDRRGASQLRRMIATNSPDLPRIPARDETVQVSVIGNHSYGTRFTDASGHIDDKLLGVFDRLCTNIDGFYFGRFDIKCESIDCLKTGNFRILELNGVGSEPLHIFDPRMKLTEAYRSAFYHWRKIYEISMLNRPRVASFMKLGEAWDAYRNVMRIQRLHHSPFTIGN